jgi:hypothetical protein
MRGVENDAADRDSPDRKLIGQELESGAGPSEQALATGPMLAEAGATTEIVERLFAEAQRKRPNDRMIQAYSIKRPE